MMLNNKHTAILAALPFIFIFIAFAMSGMAQSQPPAQLFTPLELDQRPLMDPLADNDAYQPGLLVRRQYTAVDLTPLQNGTADTLTVTFFEGETFTLTHRRTDQHAHGFVWTGYLEGLPTQTDATFSVYDGVLVGSFNALNRHYQIRTVGEPSDKLAAIEHRNYALLPPLSEPIPPPGDLPIVPQPDPNDPQADDGSIIDVLVVYTQSARQAMGGTAASNALINTAVAETNSGYQNSQINPRINLAYVAELNYTETNYPTDLDRLRITNDGYMDEVHPLRDAYHADVVVLIVNNPTFCGLAYLMTSNTVAFAPLAFSVVHYQCATGYYSFGHEIGHNMGNQHDRLNAFSEGVFNYSYGYQEPNRNFRTVMAYNCPDGGCPRVNYYANPQVSLNNRPTGVDHTASNSADIVRSMNSVAFNVANFRQRPAPPTPTPTATATATPTATPTNTPVPPTATPSTPYITAVVNTQFEQDVLIRGYNWPNNEEITIFFNGEQVATISAGHGGLFERLLSFPEPIAPTAQFAAESPTANYTAVLQRITIHNAYLPYTSKLHILPPSPTSTPTVAPTNTPTVAPTSTPTPIVNDPKAYLNQFRVIAGVPAVTFDATLDDNCWQHARYMAENNDLTHEQNNQLPYASDAGEICANNGNVWLGGAFGTPYWEPTDPINGWLSSVGHRLWLLYPTTPTFGYGFYTAANNRAGGALDVLSSFNSSADADYDGWPVRYPAAQQSGIPATDYAITLQWPYFGPTPSINSTSLTTLEGDPIPHTATTALPVGHKGIVVRSGAALPNHTVIVVTITGSYDGEPFSHSWQFGTGTAVVP